MNRRWDDGLTLVQLLVRGVLFFIALCLASFVLDGCTAPVAEPEVITWPNSYLMDPCFMNGQADGSWRNCPAPRGMQ